MCLQDLTKIMDEASAECVRLLSIHIVMSRIPDLDIFSHFTRL